MASGFVFNPLDPGHLALMELVEASGSANVVLNGTRAQDRLCTQHGVVDWAEALDRIWGTPNMALALLNQFRRSTSLGRMGMEAAEPEDFAPADREAVADAILRAKTYKIADDVPDDQLYSLALLPDGRIITHNEPGTVR